MPPGERAVVYAARLSRENGVDVALEAFARVRVRYRDAVLHVLGEGPERARLEALGRRLGLDGSVTWHGWVDFRDLPLYYSAADAFVFSGYSGGTPRVLLQAMACGAPVVASRIGGIVDHVTHGHNGLLVSAGSPRSLADALCRILGRPAEAGRLGREAARYAHAHVDWDTLVRRIREEVYVPIVESAKGRGRTAVRPSPGQDPRASS